MNNHPLHPIHALYLIDPDRARGQIMRIFREAQGSSKQAAKLSGVNRRTLLRWVKDWGLAPEIAKRWPASLRTTG